MISEHRHLAAFIVASLCSLSLPTGAFAAADSILVFNEIHYNPADDLADTEWIEFHNLNGVNVDVSGWRLRGGADFDFPEGTVVEGHGFLLVAADPANAKLAGRGAIGPFVGSLNNGGEELRLENRDRRIMDGVSYDDAGDWPIGPDGSGATLTKVNQGTADSRPGNWIASRELGGTPGLPNFPLPGAPPAEIPTLLFDWDAEWRYNETDDFPADWEDSAHPTGGNWLIGPGPLGVETSPPIPFGTILSSPFLNNPYVRTYYFEREFNLTQSQANNLVRLEIEHLFDGGGVVYINGQEVFRDRMPAGVPDSETLSTTDSDPTLGPAVGVPTGALVAGQNRISVEVHQGSGGSGDVQFGLRATLVEVPPDPSAPRDTLVFNEISSFVSPGGFRLELANVAGEEVVLAGYQIGYSEGGAYTFIGGSMAAGELLVLDAATLGFAPGDNDRLFLYDPAGQLIDARRVSGRLRGLSDEFGNRWLYPSAETFGTPNSFAFEHDIVINEIMYNPRPQPATPDTEAVVDSVTLMDWSALWRFNESGADLGGSWQNSAHAVGGDWGQGAGPLGFDSSQPDVPIATTLTSPIANNPKVITYYFETDLVLTQPDLDAISQLQLVHQIDDGAVFYINGQEIFRFEMPAGAPTAATLATDLVSPSDAEIEGPVNVPMGALVAGSNRISVEVHQNNLNSSDIVFGMQLLAIQEISPFVAGQPFRPSQEETWVELYNRSPDRSIPLDGWRFSDGIDFTFPPATSLAPGEYLVVAKDAALLAPKHPGVNVLGNFAGSLSRRGERLRLVDANDNPADEVRYFDGGRWPGAPDGGGSSLELRDPDADNALPGAWSASEETHRGSWNTYTRTGRATSGNQDPSQYHELVFGLLDAGEILIDDISVIEDPGTGSARELIQNGDFSSGNAQFWRMRGTQRHHQVVDDPDDPGNQVLHLMASGSTEHMHNCAETTLKDGANFVSINAGKDYRIRFRARWLSGSNQLNSRLYFNRIPRTDILAIDDPNGGGTPGAPNSTAEPNSGPSFMSPLHDPAVPPANQTVEVSAFITDPDGVASAMLHYAVGDGPFQQAPMVAGAGGRFAGTIPSQSGGSRVRFYIEAEDGLGARSFFPREKENSGAFIPWDDGLAELERNGVNPTNLRIVTTPADAILLHTPTEVMSNDRLSCTVIHNESEIYYGCGVRLKSSQRGRNQPGRYGFNIRFPSDKPFLGAHRTVSCDRGGQQEIMVKHMAAQVGAVPSMYDDLAWVVQPRSSSAGSVILLKSRFDGEWLDNQYPNGADGRLFEYELIYHPTTTTGGVEGLKIPEPDGVRAVGMRNQGGDDKELYRWHWLIKNNKDADDYSGLINLLDTMGLPTAEYNATVDEVMDVDQWLRTFAYLYLTAIGDNYGTSGGQWHNAWFFIRPTDGKAMFFPWDMDFTFSNGSGSGVTGNPDLGRMLSASPANERAYYGHLRDMIDTTFNTGYMDSWLSHYTLFLQQSLTGNSGFISSRGSTVTGLINAAVSDNGFGVTTASGGSTGQFTTTVGGDGWVDVREIRLAGSAVPLEVTWIDDNSWEVSLPVAPGANNYTIEAVGFDGVVFDSDTFSITGTGTVVPADSSTLAIAEINYHPVEPSAEEITAGFADASMFEWIELVNLSATEVLDLGGIVFDAGINFTVPGPALLQPGDRLVVPANAAAFEERYGPLVEGILLAASYLAIDGSNKFADGGETVRLLSAAGPPIADFIYSDMRPWPVSADGNGYSLTMIRPDLNDPNLPQNWRSSAAPGGSPGEDDSIPLALWQTDNGVLDVLSDDDGDGRTGLEEYFSGSSPSFAGGTPVQVEVDVNGELRLLIVQRIGADDATASAQRSDELGAWDALGVEYWGRENNGDGTATLRYRTPNGAVLLGDTFLRALISETP